MLQPCHMSAGLLLLLLTNPNKSSITANLLFNIYLHTQWGAIAALIFPDLRDQYLIGETFNFFAGNGGRQRMDQIKVSLILFKIYRACFDFGCSRLHDIQWKIPGVTSIKKYGIFVIFCLQFFPLTSFADRCHQVRSKP